MEKHSEILQQQITFCFFKASWQREMLWKTFQALKILVMENLPYAQIIVPG